MEKMNRVFTYGILQSYHKDYKGVHLVSEDVYPKQRYEMGVSGFPLITPNDRGHHVRGTLLEVNDNALRMFDGIEGEGRFYNRVEREMNDGTKAFVYEIPRERRGNRKFDKKPGQDGFLKWRD